MSEINTQKISVLQALFETNRMLQVPYFQRSYTWEKDLIQELWDDIQTGILNETNSEHFMGTFIFSDPEEDGSKNNGPIKELIIDGQQRITTLTILLRAMYDNLTPNSNLAGHILSYIIGGRYSNNQFKRLILGEDVFEFFEKYIQNENPNTFRQQRRGKKRVEKRIVQAYQFFFNEIKQEAKRQNKKPAKFIEYLFIRLKEKLVAVRIKVDQDTDAYAIFETINSKKVELSVSELLKNYLFLQSQKISESVLLDTRKEWNEIIENLSHNEEEIEPSQLIRHYWISNIDSVTEKNLYRAIKTHYGNDRDKLKKFISQLSHESFLYAKLVGAFKADSDETIDDHSVKLLEQIKILRIKQCYPLLLSALSIKLPKGQFKELLKAVIRVSILRGLTDRNPNELEDTYAKGARELRKKGSNITPNIIKEINQSIPKEKEIKEYIQENEISEQLARFILTQYELNLRNQDETELGKLSLEHILPQSPSNLDSDWDMTTEEHRAHVGKLGNLVLLGKRLNQEASNKSFSNKIIILKESEIKSTSKLANEYKKWGKKEINNRTSELLNFVLENWR